MNTSNLSSLIWNTADDVLRGLFKPHEYGSVILPFVVMRRLDCTLEKTKDQVLETYKKLESNINPTPVIKKQIGLPYFNNSKFDLSRLKEDPNNVYLNFNNYLQGFSDDVRDILENFKMDPLIKKLNEDDSLYLLIDKFTEFDLHPEAVDNHQMGSVYEELLRKFSEMSNEESGDHFTPRDVVQLLVNLTFEEDKDKLQGQDKIRTIFDPCCGTGGMLTIGKEWLLENVNKDLVINLFGQELNDTTYAICKSDMLMLSEEATNIRGPKSSLKDDQFPGKKFNYMITNPPFGVSWKKEATYVNNEAKDPNGRFHAGLPRTSDGSLLFLQHLIHKMEPDGARIGIVFNGSPLFTGDAGSGESDIRKWILESDLLEAIIALPDRMFFNTGITTYLWLLSNKKSPKRKGKVQLIDASSFYSKMRKNLGDKGHEISDSQKESILALYRNFEETEFCKIYPNEFFGYTKVTVEQPLVEDGQLKTDKKGKPKPDSSKRDTERIPLSEDIEEYFSREVRPHLPDAWMDRTKDKIGYEINFTKYFYKFTPLRSLEAISEELQALDKELTELSKNIL